MPSTPSKTSRRIRSLALRADPARESRFALGLIVLIGLATISVLATTSALSHHHASERLGLASP